MDARSREGGDDNLQPPRRCATDYCWVCCGWVDSDSVCTESDCGAEDIVWRSVKTGQANVAVGTAVDTAAKNAVW